MAYEQQLIDGVREYYDLPSKVTDEEVLELSKDSFGGSSVKCGIAWRKLQRICRLAFARDIRRLKKFLRLTK